MNTSTLSLRNIVVALIAGSMLFLGSVQFADAQTATAAATRPDAQNSLQDAGCGWRNWYTPNCLLGPIARMASSGMLSVGGALLELTGSIFDFAMNHVIINFKDTLDTKMGLMPVINGGWTFFRDIANILMIGMFVFIAISLILGIKEYGQKKLIARVLIIAVLMNFSLLFTKIIIDSSNFMAYAIYSQTAGRANTAGAAQSFSVADKILKPLHITGTWDTAKLAAQVYKDPKGGGVWKVLFFGFFGFLILSFLAIILLYGAFLIIARAVLFVVLMLSAPLAYVTYLVPSFEASQFGWSSWWKSLINNAAFAPLLMIFLSISILIFQTASPALGVQDTLGNLAADPQGQVRTDGWRILFVYFLGTGLLFLSFRLSSSLAGSISGIKVGQMAAGIPLAFGMRGAGFLGQRTIGYGANKSAQSKGALASQARLNANREGISKKERDFFNKQAEKYEGQKARREMVAGSSFNLMNTALGKAIAGGAGLKGVAAGEKKGSFKETVDARSKAAIEQAAKTNLTDDDKATVRKAALAEAENTLKPQRDASQAKVVAAEAALEQAKSDRAAISDAAVAAATAAVQTNRTARGAEETAAKNTLTQSESGYSTMKESHDRQIADLTNRHRNASSEQEKTYITEEIARQRATHQSALDTEKRRIDDARKEVMRIQSEIEAPLQDVRIAEGKIALRTTELGKARDAHTEALKGIEKKKTAAEKEALKTLTDQHEAYKPERFQKIAEKQAGFNTWRGVPRATPLGSAAAHKIEHDLAHKYKSLSDRQRLIQALNKRETSGGGTETPETH